MNDIEGIIRRAAAAEQPFDFIYRHPERGPERRALIPDPDEPIRHSAAGDALVMGRDLKREGARNFRIDRIVTPL